MDTPWASGPLLDEASGDFLYVPMTFSGADKHLPELLAIVERSGLVCFDPQADVVYPRPVRSAPRRRGTAAAAGPGVARARWVRLPLVLVVVAALLLVLDRCSG